MPPRDEAGPVRIPLAETIESRDATTMKDALSCNYFAEQGPNNRTYMVRRFGLRIFRQFTAGAGNGLFAFQGTDVSVVGATLRIGTTVVSSALNTAGGPYQFVLTLANTGFFLKNTTNAYFYNGSTLTAIGASYPANTVWGVAYLDGTIYVMDTSGTIWNSGVGAYTTWNALSFIAANSTPDEPIAIGRYLNYVVAFLFDSVQFFYDAGVTPPASPLLPAINATAAVGCSAPGTICVTDNTILWVGNTLQFGRSVYQLVNGIPQSVSNPYIDRILNAASTTGMSAFFIKTVGHAFYVLTISNLNITIVLDLTTGFWSQWSSMIAGSNYLIQSITSVTNPINGIITVTAVIPGHGLTNGNLIVVNGGNLDPSVLGVVVPNVVDINTLVWTIEQVAIVGTSYLRPPITWVNNASIAVQWVNAASVTVTWVQGTSVILPSDPLSIAPFDNNQFSAINYANTSSGDVLQDATSGVLYLVNQLATTDFGGAFIYGLIRTAAGDFGNNQNKFQSRIEIIADKAPEIAFVGWSDNDYQSYNYFRQVLLSSKRSQLYRGSKFRRRAFSLIYAGFTAIRFYQLELDLTKS